MVAVVACPLVVAQFFDNTGAPASGGSLLTTVGGANFPTYSDSAGATPLPNPIPLNSRGEVSTAAGASAQLFLAANTVYTFTLLDKNGNQLWNEPYINGIQLTSTQIAAALYPQTIHETGLTIVNGIYPPGVPERYATNAVPGTTDMTAAIQAAVTQQLAGGAAVQLLGGYLVSATCIQSAASQQMLVVRGVAGVSYIVNVAPSSNPTVLLTDHQNFDLRDFVLIGRSAYPNRGIDLTSASGGQRTGYGLISNVACYTNGTGIHIAGANDIVIRSCSYWPGGEAAVPGSPSFNTSGGNPVNLFGGILSDCIGVDGIYNPGSVNLIKIYDFNCGQCNTISGGGAAIKIDGSLASGGPNAGAQLPFTAWTLDGMDSGTCARALWVRNAIISKFRPTYCTAEVRIDQASANCVIENLYGSTVVVDGTQSLGGCKGIEFNGCEASTITADAANSNSIHRNCFWFAAAGAGDLDLSIGKMVLNGQLTSVPLADQIGGNGLCVGQSTGTPTVLSNNSVITPAGGVFQRFTSSGAVTGLSITAPNVNSGLFGRMLVIGNLNSSGSFTFAAAPGSNVANGTGCVIGPNTQKLFFWDKVNSIYYPSSTV